MEVEITHLQLTLDKLQFLQLSETTRLLNILDRQMQLLSHRPKFRPNKDPRSWWFYAVKLVTKNESLFSTRIENMMFFVRARRRYIFLLRRKRESAGVLLEYQDTIATEMSFLESEELVHLESILPLFTLLLFRQLAAREDEKTIVKVQGTMNSRVPEKQTWWGWASDVSSPDSMREQGVITADEDVDLEFIRREMESYSDVDTSNKSIALKLKLSSSASLHLNNNKVRVVESNMSLSFSGCSRIDSTSAYFAIEDFIAIDKFSPTPVIENIVSLKPDLMRDEAVPIFAAEYEHTTDRKATLKISALPLQLVLNELCIQQLMSFFNSSQAARSTILKYKSDEAPSSSFPSSTEDTLSSVVPPSTAADRQRSLRIDLPALISSSQHGIEIVFEAETSKIIIPENSNSNVMGYGLFEAGHLIVRGYVSYEGMARDISLGIVNAGMPLSVDEMYSFGQSMYLIRPFDVSIHVQTLNRSLADMSVDIQVKPEIRGQLDASKLARLLTVIHVLVKAFTVKPKDLLLNESHSQEDFVALAGEGAEKCSSAPSIVDIAGDCSKEWIIVKITVPNVVLDLYYNIVEGDHLLFSVLGLETDVVLRYLDMRVGCRYQSLLIEDSMRSAGQRTLLRNDL